MELMEWGKSFETGVELIDSQHKILVGKLNELNNHILNNSSKAYLNSLLNELTDYTFYHFDTEELFFDLFSYAEKEKHLNEHQFFRDKLIRFKEKLIFNAEDISMDLLLFLTDWISHHILNTDMDYVKNLKRFL